MSEEMLTLDDLLRMGACKVCLGYAHFQNHWGSRAHLQVVVRHCKDVSDGDAKPTGWDQEHFGCRAPDHKRWLTWLASRDPRVEKYLAPKPEPDVFEPGELRVGDSFQTDGAPSRLQGQGWKKAETWFDYPIYEIHDGLVYCKDFCSARYIFRLADLRTHITKVLRDGVKIWPTCPESERGRPEPKFALSDVVRRAAHDPQPIDTREWRGGQWYYGFGAINGYVWYAESQLTPAPPEPKYKVGDYVDAFTATAGTKYHRMKVTGAPYWHHWDHNDLWCWRYPTKYGDYSEGDLMPAPPEPEPVQNFKVGDLRLADVFQVDGCADAMRVDMGGTPTQPSRSVDWRVCHQWNQEARVGFERADHMPDRGLMVAKSDDLQGHITIVKRRHKQIYPKPEQA